jgi:diketogulonate reductase-like aldo/keto reductase/NAD(P)-dependent dehydrogenase (short-subunit alcohol dehydrogenase family)
MNDEVVVLIGAGSIGQAIARRVGAGKHILIADLHEPNAKAAAQVMRDAGFEVTTTTLDVSSRPSVHAVTELAASLGDISRVIHAAGVSPSQAPPAAILAVDLYGTALVLEELGNVISAGGAGIVIASQSGHRLPALTPDEDRALATTPADELLALPLLQDVTDSLHAYQLAKRGNALRVQAEAVRWAERGARVNCMSPGIVITPLANDELTGPRGEGYRRMLELSPAGRAATPDEIAHLAALLLGPDGALSPEATSSSTAASPPPTSTDRSHRDGPTRPTTTRRRKTLMTASLTTITLNNGVDMPALGLGVFQTPPDETRDAVRAALDCGYRLIDSAAAYGNERQVGDAVRAAGLDRADLFVETKIWISDYGYDETLHGFDKSTAKLGLDQIDLLILHQALPSAFDRTLDAYRALETLLGEGKVRAIGVSNFMVDHLKTLLDRAEVVPAVNQIECHPYFQQPDVQAYGTEHGIVTQAWSPIGGITFYRDSGHSGSTLEDPVVRGIADAHGKTPAQVLLRWGLQHGRSVIPKSTKPTRIAENFDVFDFELSADEMTAIDRLDTGHRGGPEPEVVTLESFGRAIPEADAS